MFFDLDVPVPEPALAPPATASGGKKDKKGKGKDTGSLPVYINFVHLVEIVFSSNFSGIIPDYKSDPPGVVDFTMPEP